MAKDRTALSDPLSRISSPQNHDRSQLRDIWNAETLKAAETELDDLVASHRDSAPNLATWLEKAVPENPAVFSLPEPH